MSKAEILLETTASQISGSAPTASENKAAFRNFQPLAKSSITAPIFYPSKTYKEEKETMESSTKTQEQQTSVSTNHSIPLLSTNSITALDPELQQKLFMISNNAMFLSNNNTNPTSLLPTFPPQPLFNTFDVPDYSAANTTNFDVPEYTSPIHSRRKVSTEPLFQQTVAPVYVVEENTHFEEEKAPVVENAILGQPPKSNHINVCADHKYGIRNYLVRARRMLRLKQECIVCGMGNAVATACEVAEVLKREQIGVYHSIQTEINQSYPAHQQSNNPQPNYQPRITIVMKRGCYAHLVSDFRRRKIIEIFENNDESINGLLSKDKVVEMNLPEKFLADAVRRAQSEAMLVGKEDLNLPEFVYYCSILVHPLLLEYHFKTGIQKLGGVVDVHDGDLPAKQDEKTILEIQKMGLVPTPEKLKEMFPVNHNMHRDINISIDEYFVEFVQSDDEEPEEQHKPPQDDTEQNQSNHPSLNG